MVDASSELQSSLQKISKQKEEVDRLSNLIGAEGGEVVAGLQQEIGAKTGELELVVGECSQLKDRAVIAGEVEGCSRGADGGCKQ